MESGETVPLMVTVSLVELSSKATALPSTYALATPPPVQFAVAVFQTLLTLPVQITAAAPTGVALASVEPIPVPPIPVAAMT